MVLDPAAKRYDDASTLVRVTGGPDQLPEILRPGPIDEAQLLAALDALNEGTLSGT